MLFFFVLREGLARSLPHPVRPELRKNPWDELFSDVSRENFDDGRETVRNIALPWFCPAGLPVMAFLSPTMGITGDKEWRSADVVIMDMFACTSFESVNS
jgi:hypothetical protein